MHKQMFITERVPSQANEGSILMGSPLKGDEHEKLLLAKTPPAENSITPENLTVLTGELSH
jgi:hypothetical protein